MCLVWLKICSPPWIRAFQTLLQRALIQCSSCAWLAWTNSGNQFWKRIFFLWINIYIPTIFGGMDIQKSWLQLGPGDSLSQMALSSGFNRGAEADADGIAPLPRLRTADYAVDVGEELIEEALLRKWHIFLHQEGGPWILMYIIASCIGQSTKDGKGIKGFGKWTWWYPSRPNGLSSFSLPFNSLPSWGGNDSRPCWKSAGRSPTQQWWNWQQYSNIIFTGTSQNIWSKSPAGWR